jgi:sugar O-acyltransferase (sialic acid O-acetyltransferase NeuD family)
MMRKLILFAVGSALTVEYEETCARLGVEITAWVRNRPGDAFCAMPQRLIAVDHFDPEFASAPFLCPLFTPQNRRAATSQAESLGLRPAAALIDPFAVLARALSIGDGTYINSSVTIGAASIVGRHVVINRSASIGHHAVIGDFVSIGPGAVLAGQVRLNEGAMLGAGCVLLPKVAVGAHAIVGAGSIVTRDVAPRTLVYGNPATVIRADLHVNASAT